MKESRVEGFVVIDGDPDTCNNSTHDRQAHESTAYLKFAKIEVCFLWLSLPGHYRVTDEALLAETT